MTMLLLLLLLLLSLALLAFYVEELRLIGVEAEE